MCINTKMSSTQARKLIVETIALNPTGVEFYPGRTFLRFADNAIPKKVGDRPTFQVSCWWDLEGTAYEGAITLPVPTTAYWCNKLTGVSK